MIIPDNETVVYKTYNELKKATFYKQGLIISLIPCGFIASCYVFLKALNPIFYFIFVALFYTVLSVYTIKKLYKDYLKFYGSDELAFSNTKIYFNVCMNKSGTNINVDGNRYINEINDVYIKGGWNPKRLIICFSDGEYIAIHSLKNINEVLEYIKALPLANIKNI